MISNNSIEDVKQMISDCTDKASISTNSRMQSNITLYHIRCVKTQYGAVI